MKTYEVSVQGISIECIDELSRGGVTISLSEQAKAAVTSCHTWLLNKIKESDAPIYGVNTGFGSLANEKVKKEDLETLQRNLIISHACGSGEEVSDEVVRAMLLLRIHNMAMGHSGVALATVQRMIDHYNEGVLPIVYKRGSLGASGDLAPLSHLALPLIGVGKVRWKGKTVNTTLALEELRWEPLVLGPKEGLALNNGTAFMAAFGALLVARARRLADLADVVAAIALEGFDGNSSQFYAGVHELRPHPGQIRVAQRMRKLLEGSAIQSTTKTEVQDPYCFRCVPQVHGASRDAIAYVESVIERELRSVTDNPIVFPADDRIVSAGNFHGQPLALVLDFLAIALAEIGSISERRTYKLLNGLRGLEAYLTPQPGLNSGFMIPQYTAAALVSANKMRAMPNSVDTIDSSNGQEDHVSMGANAAVKCWEVLEDAERILAIELFTAAQALHMRRTLRPNPNYVKDKEETFGKRYLGDHDELRTSALLENFVASFRAVVPFIESDVYMHVHMEAAQTFARNAALPEV